jgi:3-methyladenine DNA glycosylase AlkD
MPTARARSSGSSAAATRASRSVAEILAWLERRGSKRNRDGMARYGIVAPKAYGVSMATMLALTKRLGRDHDLALALWDTGWYEARQLVAFVGDPARLTPREMDRFCADFDNWAIVDGLCFHLFDKSPHAAAKIRQWARRAGEFQKRAAFALMAGLALHDKRMPDAAFSRLLPLAATASTDARNFVKKGVSWGLRSVGHRTSGLHAEVMALATTLSRSADATARWIGKDVLRDLERPMVKARVARRPPL